MKKIFWLLILIFSLSFLYSCDSSKEDGYSNDERHKIYLLAQTSGYTGTYEEWLASISGKEIVLTVTSDNKLMWKYNNESDDKARLLLDLSTLKGETGNGILSIEKTGQNGLIDIYTITFTNGTTTTFTVTNGMGSGMAIKTTYVDDNGDLIVEYTDGTKQNAGHVTHKHYYKYNENEHWLECSCGDKYGTSGHDYVRKSLDVNADGKSGTITWVCQYCGYEKQDSIVTDVNARTPQQDKEDLEQAKFRVYVYEREGESQVLADREDGHMIAIMYAETAEKAAQYATMVYEDFLMQARFEEKDGVYVCLSAWKITGRRIVLATHAEDMELIEYWNNISNQEALNFKTEWSHNEEIHYHEAVGGNKDVYYAPDEHEFEAGDFVAGQNSGTITYTCKVCGYSYQKECYSPREDELSYHVVGGFDTWTAYNYNKMENCDLGELKKLDSNLVAKLQQKGVKHLYSAVINMGTSSASYTQLARFMENGKTYTVDMCYTLKIVMCEPDSGSYESVQWIPDPKTAHVEALTNNYFIPTWQEDEDANGFSWSDNPVVTSGAGKYLVVVADYGKESNETQCGYGIAVIKIGEVEKNSSVLDSLEDNVKFEVLVNGKAREFDDFNQYYSASSRIRNAAGMAFTLKSNANVVIKANGKALNFEDNNGEQTGSYTTNGYGYYEFWISRSLEVWVNYTPQDEPAPEYRLILNDSPYYTGSQSFTYPNISCYYYGTFTEGATIQITYDDENLSIADNSKTVQKYTIPSSGSYEFFVIDGVVNVNTPSERNKNGLKVKINGVYVEKLTDVNTDSASNKAAYKFNLAIGDIVEIENGSKSLAFCQWNGSTQSADKLGYQYSIKKAGYYTFWINNNYEVYIQTPDLS